MVWRDLNVRNKTNKQPFFIERLFWSEISLQSAANGEVLIINVCPFFFLLVLSQFLVLFCLVQLFLQERSASSHQRVNQVAKSLKLNFNDPLVVVRVSRLPRFCFRFEMLQFIRSMGSHQTLKVANKFFFHVKCYNSKDPQVLIRPSRLPIFSFISNAIIHQICKFLSNLPSCQDSPQFQILQLKIQLVLIEISSLPRFSGNFNATNLRDPQVIIKISRLPRFSLKIHRISSKPQSLEFFCWFQCYNLKIHRFSSKSQGFWSSAELRINRFSRRSKSQSSSEIFLVISDATILKIRRFSSISRAAQILWYFQMIQF